MGNSSSSNNTGSQSKNRAQIKRVDNAMKNPDTPTAVLMQARNAVYQQKSTINKAQQKALNVVMNSIDRTKIADDQYTELSRVIKNRVRQSKNRVASSNRR